MVQFSNTPDSPCFEVPGNYILQGGGTPNVLYLRHVQIKLIYSFIQWPLKHMDTVSSPTSYLQKLSEVEASNDNHQVHFIIFSASNLQTPQS